MKYKCPDSPETPLDQYLIHEYRGHRVVAGRILAWRFGIEWHRVDQVIQELENHVPQHNPHHGPEFWDTGERVDCAYFVEEGLNEVFARCGSPIEELFLAALARINLRWDFDPTNGRVGWTTVFDNNGDISATYEVFSQLPIDRFRADFAVSGPGHRLVIELDGHDFHERTKQQAERDKSRDRALSAAGWTVLRFTGSEVWRDPFECAREVLRMIRT